MFPSGSSSTSNSPEQCTTVVITNDRTPEDDDYFNLHASSSDPSVFFTPGRKNVSVLVQDDDSRLYTYNYSHILFMPYIAIQIIGNPYTYKMHMAELHTHKITTESNYSTKALIHTCTFRNET